MTSKDWWRHRKENLKWDVLILKPSYWFSSLNSESEEFKNHNFIFWDDLSGLFSHLIMSDTPIPRSANLWSWKVAERIPKVILSEPLINQYYYKHLFNWPSVIFVRKTAKFRKHREISRNVPTKTDKNVREVSVRVKSFDQVIQHKDNPSNDYSIIPLAWSKIKKY